MPECKRCSGTATLRLVEPGTTTTMAYLCLRCADLVMRATGAGEAVAGRMTWPAVNAGYAQWRRDVDLPPGPPITFIDSIDA